MALQASGAISFSEIQTEFSGSNPISLSSFYRGGNVTNNNTNVPTSGAISFSNFYSALVNTITYVGGVTKASGGGGGSQTITIAGALTGGVAVSPSVGDLVILAYCVCGGNIIGGVSAGWTLYYDAYNASPTGRTQDTNLVIAYKFWAAGDSAVTYTVSTSGNNASASVVHVYRDVRFASAGIPFIFAQNLQTNNASTYINPSQITTTSKNFIACVIAAFGHNDSSTLTPPGNLSNVISANGNDYRDARISMGTSAIISNAGVYNPSVWTMATATDRAPISVTLGLRPS